MDKSEKRQDNSGSIDRDQSINTSTQQHSQGTGNPNVSPSRTDQSVNQSSSQAGGQTGNQTGRPATGQQSDRGQQSNVRQQSNAGDNESDDGQASRQTTDAGKKLGQV